MKTICKPTALAGIAGVVLFLALSSFSLMRGGDSYTVSVNGKQLIQYYVHSKDALPRLTLNSGAQDIITVYYSECGKIGTSRKLSVRDDQNNVLKEWKFANVTDEHAPMTINSKDVVAKGSTGLYYSSESNTVPRKLLTLVATSGSTASR